ncbi:unnamed protein product [Oppiella nova]|uniref:G-protein coupled receptors family 1 profile domain-containing protein n=1 Tax=Oppiella nova TaxID=334625 RepID=A0A7R9QR94_9ACAR|nr:unnamed protein product [Oppiella nova]CAG2172044.1 unnamed protein product [Oppiella nova]
MLMLIVVMFAICWLPIQLFGLIVWFHPISLDTDLQYNLYVGLYFASHWLSMSHSFINPLIYSYMSSNFRVLLRHSLFLDTDLQYNLYVGLYFASHWLSMSHSFINPLIYSYMSSNFRTDLWKMLRRFKPKIFRSFNEFRFNNNFELSDSQYSHEISYN